MVEKVYVTGHQNPDTDSICSAIAYAELKNQLGDENTADYVPMRIGQINAETAYVLDRFGVKEPEFLEDGSGKALALVDHNEETQSVPNVEEADVVEVIDHHKINFQSKHPIFFHNEPLGSTATIIAQKFMDCNLELDKKIAGLLLSSILSDTVVFKSATTTQTDKKVAEKLKDAAQVEDVVEYGIEVKKAKSSLEGISAEEIILSDFKEFDFNGYEIGIGQVEVVDRDEFSQRRDEFVSELKRLRKEKEYDLMILMVTEIIAEGSELIVDGLNQKVEQAFDKEVSDDSMYLDGVMSRKKQVVPPLQEVFF